MRTQWKWPWVVVLLVVGGLPAWASAETIYGFTGVTNNKVADTATGAAQLFVGVSDASVGGQNRAAFRFFNLGPAASSIADVYFDDGSLLGIASITSSAGVSFSQGASPGNLPGGNGINFATTAGFLADSDAPVQPNGVNPGESLTITFNLINGNTFADTLAAIEQGLALGSTSNQPGQPTNLRIGIHVQGFDGGGSESFVNGPPRTPVVPLPPAVIAGTVLMAGMALRRLTTATRA
jgi:hypothetical protein